MTTRTHTWPLESIAAGSWRKPAATIGLWALQIVAAAAFIAAGIAKLTGAAPMVQLFAAIGAGQWFRYGTGAIEVISAILLVVPTLAVFGAAALAVTMTGAVLTHLFILGNSPAIPIALLAIVTTIVWGRRSAR